MLKIYLRPGSLGQLYGIVKDGQISQTQKVHLKKSELFERRHCILGHDTHVVFGQWDILVYRRSRYYNTGRVG